jgi:hypothetical protein
MTHVTIYNVHAGRVSEAPTGILHAGATNLKGLDGKDALQHEQHAPFHRAHRQAVESLYDKERLWFRSTCQQELST